jgi:hypothetical protein
MGEATIAGLLTRVGFACSENAVNTGTDEDEEGEGADEVGEKEAAAGAAGAAAATAGFFLPTRLSTVPGGGLGGPTETGGGGEAEADKVEAGDDATDVF